MLGVRREGVTEGRQAAEERRDRVQPGHITVLDRARLEELSANATRW
jgi:hypothetical protein